MASVLDGVPQLQNVNVQPALSNFAGMQDQQARLSQMAQQMDVQRQQLAMQKQSAANEFHGQLMTQAGNIAANAKSPEEYATGMKGIADYAANAGYQNEAAGFAKFAQDPSTQAAVKAQTGDYYKQQNLDIQKQDLGLRRDMLNKPSIEHVVDPVTMQPSFYRVPAFNGEAQPVQLGGAPGMAAPPSGSGTPPAGAPGGAEVASGGAAAPAGRNGVASLDPAVEEALSHAPPGYQDRLRGLLNYSVDPRLERAAGRGGLLALAQQYDPTYNPANFPARAAAIKDATSGKMAAANNSLNTGIGHLDQLVDAVAGLDNGNFTPLNAVKNAGKTMLGDPGVTNFKAVADRVAPEITRIWRGVGGSESDIARDLATLSSAGSPQQLYGAIGNIAKMMQSKIDSNQYQYEQAVPGRPIQMIRPEAEAVIAKLETLANGDGGKDPRFGAYFSGNDTKTAGGAPDPGAIEAEMRRRGLLK